MPEPAAGSPARRAAHGWEPAYLALAEARGCRLVTTDGKLRDCPARRCDVQVVTPGRPG